MKLYLNGGGGIEKLVKIMDIVNGEIDHDKPILYVPLAMDESERSYDECYEWFKEVIANLKVNGLDMPRTFEEWANIDLNKYSFIFIGGGNTYKLLKGIKDNGIFEKIVDYLNNDGIIIGGSAGAVIFGYDVNSIFSMDPNDVGLKDTKGFNMLDGKSIFAHYTNSKTEAIHRRYTEYLKYYSAKGESVYAIPEEDTICINNGEIKVIGTKSYYEFTKGMRNKKGIENG